MERIWLNSYPRSVRAEIDADAFGSIGEFFAALMEKFRYRTAFVSMGRAISFDELDRLSGAFNNGTVTEIAHCRPCLTGYKTPRRVEFRDTLPRTALGKVLRRELQDDGRVGGE